MSDNNTLILQARKHDKLGHLHCGVTRTGWVSVAGAVSPINEGQTVEFPKVKVAVTRNGDNYEFRRH